jgi:hypothetical protein
MSFDEWSGYAHFIIDNMFEPMNVRFWIVIHPMDDQKDDPMDDPKDDPTDDRKQMTHCKGFHGVSSGFQEFPIGFTSVSRSSR